MKHLIACVLAVLYASTLGGGFAHASSSAQTDHAKVELVADTSDKGEFWAGIHVELAEGWHIYWKNPGDSGLEPTLKWTLPEDITAGPVHWQAPKRIQYGTLFNYGYENQTMLLVPIMPQEADANRSFDLKVKVDWLICKEICIPESAELSLPITLGEQTPDAAAAIKPYAATLPRPLKEHGSFAINNTKVTLNIPLNKKPVDSVASVWWFPLDDGIITNASDQKWTMGKDGIVITAERGSSESLAEYRGVLEVRSRSGGMKHWFVTLKNDDISVPANTTKPAASPEKNTENTTLLIALISAFLGGLILNIMPCVLPILSLKALSISKKAHGDQRIVRQSGLAYTAGVMISFAAIASLLIGLQQAGEQIGWGFQLQSPAFVLAMSYLLFLVGLNLSGAYELPVLFGQTGNTLTQQSGLSGHFFTGVLATLVATPCTAPFMATALGFALGQPPLLALMIFLALGFGLAFPLLLISFVPALTRLLPKPGAWMVRFKEFLAFPIYATVAWLLWVLVQQSGAMGLALAFAGICAIAFAVWAVPLLNARKILQTILLVAVCIGVAHTIRHQPTDSAMMQIETSDSKRMFSQATLDELRAQKIPVFVDATAAWCITCKINEQGTLASDTVQDLFKEHGVITLVADWTNRDEHITQYLASFNRNGVPMYVFYAPNKEPILLPQILTPTHFTELFTQ